MATQTVSLREHCERVFEDYARWSAHNERESRERQAKSATARATEIFGLEPDLVDGRVVIYGDIRLRLSGETFVLLQRCPDCGEEYEADFVGSVHLLAQALHSEHHHGFGQCPNERRSEGEGNPIQLSGAERRLIEAIRDIVNWSGVE